MNNKKQDVNRLKKRKNFFKAVKFTLLGITSLLTAVVIGVAVVGETAVSAIYAIGAGIVGVGISTYAEKREERNFEKAKKIHQDKHKTRGYLEDEENVFDRTSRATMYNIPRHHSQRVANIKKDNLER